VDRFENCVQSASGSFSLAIDTVIAELAPDKWGTTGQLPIGPIGPIVQPESVDEHRSCP
jgi:hypothetical protein